MANPNKETNGGDSSKGGKATLLAKNVPNATTTEINERDPKHFFEGAHSQDGTAGLPFTDIPRHLGVDQDDENELDEGYARVGASDRGETRDEEDLEADESEALDETGV